MFEAMASYSMHLKFNTKIHKIISFNFLLAGLSKNDVIFQICDGLIFYIEPSPNLA